MNILEAQWKRPKTTVLFFIAVFLIYTAWRYATYSRQGPSKEHYALDCNSFYASDLIGCGEHSPSNSLGAGKTGLAADGKLSSNVAMIVETRLRSKLIPLLLHYASILGPSWPIHVYTTPEIIAALPKSVAMKREMESGRIKAFTLPLNTSFPHTEEYSAFMTRRWIWEAVKPAEHVLVFQADSIVCANSPKSLGDFRKWDFIGAPIDEIHGHGYNGGLSLRKWSSTMRVLERFNWTDYPRPAYEDQWYYERLLELQEEDRTAGIEAKIWLPSLDVAKTFAVETIDYPYPLGLHQARRFPKDEEVDIDEYCPEYKLCY